MDLKRVILTSRPAMWAWPALIFLVGIGDFSNLSTLAVIELALFTFPLNYYLYGVNDLYDSESDRLNPRKDGVQGIVPSDSEMSFLKKTTWIAPAIFLLVALVTRNPEHIGFSVFFIFLCFAYSHRLIRLKEIPLIDSLTSALIYCLPGIIAYSLHAPVSSFPLEALLILLPYMGIHSLTTLLDEDEDAKVGMTTIGVVFGRNGTAIFSLLAFAICAAFLRDKLIIMSAALVTMMFHIIFLFAKKQDKIYRFGLSVVSSAFLLLCQVYYIFLFNS
jgi:lycopene elongase/hydratase (dihydrobisanhydrobacterioruberin-forming)